MASALTIACMTLPAAAQEKRVEHQGPRAIAVVEFASAPANAAPSKPGRVLPVTIYYNGEYNDATLYNSTPVPMALEPETVYEVQRGGVPLGLLTLTHAAQQTDQSWFARGDFEPAKPESPPEKKLASSVNINTRTGRATAVEDEDDDRPVLKHRAEEQSPASAPAQTPSAAPAPVSASTPTSAPAASPASAPAASAAASAVRQQQAQTAEEADPNRPVLRRGKSQPPAEEPVEATTAPAGAAAHAANSAQTGLANPAAPALLVAVSDAAPTDSAPFKFPWTADEQAQLTQKMQQLALSAAQQYERDHRLPPGKTWSVSDVRAFELFTDNDAELVFTGTQPTRGGEVYVTVVGMAGLDGNMVQLFADVTDRGHLDVKGRLELIDAVDSTGSGRGDLLFRRIGRHTQSFELYRVTRNQLWSLFQGAQTAL